jgi:hypothetical protein
MATLNLQHIVIASRRSRRGNPSLTRNKVRHQNGQLQHQPARGFDPPAPPRHASESWHPRLSLKVSVVRHESKPMPFRTSASFLKKRSKKLLLLRALARARHSPQ